MLFFSRISLHQHQGCCAFLHKLGPLVNFPLFTKLLKRLASFLCHRLGKIFHIRKYSHSYDVKKTSILGTIIVHICRYNRFSYYITRSS